MVKKSSLTVDACCFSNWNEKDPEPDYIYFNLQSWLKKKNQPDWNQSEPVVLMIWANQVCCFLNKWIYP